MQIYIINYQQQKKNLASKCYLQSKLKNQIQATGKKKQPC